MSLSRLVKAALKNPYQEGMRAVKGRSMCIQPGFARAKKTQENCFGYRIFFLFCHPPLSQSEKMLLLPVKNVFSVGVGPGK